MAASLGCPPLLIPRKFTFEGAPVFCPWGCRDLTSPTVIGTGTLGSDPPSWSCDHDMIYTMLASCHDPRTKQDHLDEVRCDPPPLPESIVPLLGTAHTEGDCVGRLFVPPASGSRSLFPLCSWCRVCVAEHAHHSRSARREPVGRTQDACRGYWGGAAWSHLPGKIWLPEVTVGRYHVVVHIQE